jgi:hypothetical protein
MMDEENKFIWSEFTWPDWVLEEEDEHRFEFVEDEYVYLVEPIVWDRAQEQFAPVPLMQQ